MKLLKASNASKKEKKKFIYNKQKRYYKKIICKKKKKKKKTTFDIYNKRLKKEKPCFKLKRDSPLSFQKCIEIWCDIELIKYNIHDEKLLKKLRYEIKEIIYSNILYKTKKNFQLFHMFYNYKYNYNVEYVTRQYMFNLSMKGDDTYYSLLKRYYGEKKKNKIKYGNVGNYDNNSNHSDDNNKNHCNDNNNKNHCDDNNNKIIIIITIVVFILREKGKKKMLITLVTTIL
ncbi:hypothetical protein PFTANZ_00604 [Plasmodium falciparum Tanzania (2000708)]|uniref:Plasmodium RESA N-terminal domain-containing protein n=1 Tax=Plasmodium falciparum Tanzania (2000708) TaxID=1036725 RepID=A0A024WCQ0_PLAFA|nr:hypothetical protein PFTANZ_00604 [Plasmodium falciparum Tanzania (2000708)]